MFECCSGFLCKEAGQRVRLEKSLLDLWNEAGLVETKKVDQQLGASGDCASLFFLPLVS